MRVCDQHKMSSAASSRLTPATVGAMGEMITFPSNGGTCDGYLSGGGGPGVIVIPNGGVSCRTSWTSPIASATPGSPRSRPTCTTAARRPNPTWRQADDGDRHGEGGEDMSGAIDVVIERASNPRIGVVGFCMGGGLALVLAAQRPDAVKAVAPYYGLIPWQDAQPDWSKIDAKIVGEYAELDELLHAAARRRAPGDAARPGQGRHAQRARRRPPRVLQRLTPGGVQRRARARGVGTHADVVPRRVGERRLTPRLANAGPPGHRSTVALR